jgi:hypothetical protein
MILVHVDLDELDTWMRVGVGSSVAVSTSEYGIEEA